MGRAIGVIGAGGWGTALAKLLCEKGAGVTLWSHGEDSYRRILEQRENGSYLLGIALPPSLEVTRSVREAVSGKEIIFCAVPSHGVREVMQEARPHVPSEAILVCGTKGIEDTTLQTMGELLAEIFGAAKREIGRASCRERVYVLV